MMAYVDEADGADRTEALLWAAPTGPLPAPPIDTKAQVLPIGDLHWPDAERLFLRLLHTVRPVQYAKLFGVPGQAQAGIDAYARLPLDLAHGETGGRDYITLQSRRVKSLTAARITALLRPGGSPGPRQQPAPSGQQRPPRRAA
jgi:hypothetical protein